MYIDEINTLKPNITEPELVLDLFAGCGGLSLGFESEGYLTHGYECNEYACATYNKNLHGDCVREKMSVSTQFPKADIIIGGPPCQPFSGRGAHRGQDDSRNGFPIFIEAVKQLQPKFFLFENVKGLVAKTHVWYFNEVLDTLRKLDYVVEHKTLRASDYGVAENRDRVIVVGHRRKKFSYPEVQEYKYTLRDAIGDTMETIPDESLVVTPEVEEKYKRWDEIFKSKPRDLKPDRPSKTVTCSNIRGVAGDTLRFYLPDGRRRMLTIREVARVQSFPDWFDFCGGEAAQCKQIGNAVPPMMASKLAQCVKECLKTPEISKAAIRKINKPIFEQHEKERKKREQEQANQE